MKRNEQLDLEVEKTLQALDGIERASPKPFFLTRVEARLAKKAGRQSSGNWLFRPAWVVASLGLVLILNVSAVLYARDQLAQHEQEPEPVEWSIDANVLDW